MTEIGTEPTPTAMTAICEITAAYISNNHVAPADLPALIASIHSSVVAWASDRTVPEVVIEAGARSKPTSGQIHKSIAPEILTSFIDGKSYKTLKRHLTKHGFTPDSYRKCFGLPADYPMVSTAYASRRSALAKEHKFGIRAGRGAKHRVK